MQSMGSRTVPWVVVGCVALNGIALGAAGAMDQAPADSSETSDATILSLDAVEGADVTFCELFGLRQFGSLNGIVGLATSTTSWNVGTKDLKWFREPQEEHPFIAQNLYRLKDDRFEQIGQSWLKHGFTALRSEQCNTDCTLEPGHESPFGAWLGVGCTDTYSSSLNANQAYLGPRFEVNPWTGAWDYETSMFENGGPSNTPIRRRLQVIESDLDPDQNPGALYYLEGYYATIDDVDVMNSASWKEVQPVGEPGGTWTFTMSDRGVPPEIGFAIDAWTGARQTMLAQEVPPVEFQSPDGRCLLAVKTKDLGGGWYEYEYALYNVDMDRQVGSFTLPLTPGTNIRNEGTRQPRHHDEPFNEIDGVSIDNSPWTAEVGEGFITWSTTTNPLRWGTLGNYRFEADAPPADVQVTLGMFKSGDPGGVSGVTTGPRLALARWRPEKLLVTRGVHVSGTEEQLFASDDEYVRVEARRATEVAAASVEIEVIGSVPSTDPVALLFVVEAAAGGSPAVQVIELFDYVAGVWETMDERDAPTSDTTVTVSIGTNPARFIDAETGEVRARVGIHDRGVTFPAWDGRYDQVYWSVVE
jgi:hypothetical protein